MAEYTYKDIIIDPNSEEAKNAVGKICYFSNSPRNILSDIYRKSAVEGILTNMDDGYFEVDNEGYWDCIILKKEEPKPKYVPFQDIREFLLSYSCYERLLKEDNCFLSNRGIWLMDCENGDYFLVTEIWGDGVVLGSNQTTTHWDDLLEEFIFLDGSPCGKEVKDE